MSGVGRAGVALALGVVLALCVAGLPLAHASGTVGQAQQLVAAARDEVGRPVCAGAGGYGGATFAATCRAKGHKPGFDAGTLTAYAVFRATGKRLALSVATQFASRANHGGLAVSRADLLPGDVVFFTYGHDQLGAGVYLGYGLMIDAPSDAHAVRVQGLGRHFVAAARYWAEVKAPASATSTPTDAGVPIKPAGASSTTSTPAATTPPAPAPVTVTSTGTGTGTGTAGATVPETTGSDAHTWTDYSDAGGTQGPTIPGGQTVQITCRLEGFKVSDGNVWWYQIASSPWSNGFYVSADAFYNNGETTGSLQGTPFYDPAVPVCAGTGSSSGSGSGDASGVAETPGSVVNTWTDYQDAGGTHGKSIPSNDTVYITCRVQGFEVSDGNTWWYEIASSPWSNSYYGSADAFYNNGATSGPLSGTPFYDPAVPVCPSS